MKEVLGVVAAIAIGIFGYLYVSNQPTKPNHRADQAAGASTSGASQDMPAIQAEDKGDVSETGARAQEIIATAGGDLGLSAGQLSELASYFANNLSNQVDAANVSISVGASVPRQIRLEPLPPQVVEVMQKYRGDEYLMAANKMVVVEPKSRRIVAIIPVS